MVFYTMMILLETWWRQKKNKKSHQILLQNLGAEDLDVWVSWQETEKEHWWQFMWRENPERWKKAHQKERFKDKVKKDKQKRNGVKMDAEDQKRWTQLQ